MARQIHIPEREHVTDGGECWCHPHVEAFGDEYEYDGDGNVLVIHNDELGYALQLHPKFIADGKAE